jgi:hypothetical protein
MNQAGCCMLDAGFFLALSFNPEDGDAFHQNVG